MFQNVLCLILMLAAATSAKPACESVVGDTGVVAVIEDVFKAWEKYFNKELVEEFLDLYTQDTLLINYAGSIGRGRGAILTAMNTALEIEKGKKTYFTCDEINVINDHTALLIGHITGGFRVMSLLKIENGEAKFYRSMLNKIE